VVSRLKGPAVLEVIEGGDHSFVLPKSSSTSEEEAFDRIVKRTIAWLDEIRSHSS
jgi:hypothetical protein